MGKRQEQAVGQMALPIEPWTGAASNQAPRAEAKPPEASTGAEALKGERKRKWYTLYDKVCKKGTLWRAWLRVEANKGASGSDGMTIAQFQGELPGSIRGLRRELREKRYRPRPVRRVSIPKAGGGERKLGIPTVRDRIVQRAIVAILEPIFEAKFSEHSHGFRSGRGCQSALRAVSEALESGCEWVVDADLKSFFDTVDHEILMRAVNEEIADGSVLHLVKAFLKSGVMEGAEQWKLEQGTPQGGPLSPLLANIQLHPLDEALESGGYRFVRYADDFVVLARTKQEAEEALELIREILASLGLALNEQKTRIVQIEEGFDFLGFRHFRSRQGKQHRVVSEKPQRKFKEAFRRRTRRHSGQRRRKARACKVQRLRRDDRVMVMVARVNRYLRSWLGYFEQVTPSGVRELYVLDKFVRRRLRCAIAGRYVRGRWQSEVLPNRLLAALGLVSLVELHRAHGAESLALPTSG